MMRTLSTAALLLALTATTAHAGGVDDFAAAVKDATGEVNTAWVVTKLTTFKVGPKCLAKLADKNNEAIHTATFATRDVVAYAKALTGDDWSGLESQTNRDADALRTLLEPKIDAFKARFGMTLAVDGDDCAAGSGAMWLRYWLAATTAVTKYPPPAGKAFVTINVTPKVKLVTVDVSKDGTTFTITAPRDVESDAWSDRLERPFRKLASGIDDDFAFGLREDVGSYNAAWVLTKLHTFKLGKKCTAGLADKKLEALHTASFVVRDIAAYAHAVGAEDWDGIEGQSANDAKTNRDLVAKDMDDFKARFGFTVSVDGDDCDLGHDSLWLRYWFTIAEALHAHPPRAKKVTISLTVSAKAKDVTAVVGKDGATFAFTAPRDKEVPAWDDKLRKPFEKVARKP
jgi:hypothetical protein